MNGKTYASKEAHDADVLGVVQTPMGPVKFPHPLDGSKGYRGADGVIYPSVEAHDNSAAVQATLRNFRVASDYKILDDANAKALKEWQTAEALAVGEAILAHPVVSPPAPPRKSQPMARGLLDYFPQALLAVSACSFIANEQHNPGEPMHWARAKSTDHADCIIRHLIDRGTVDTDGVRHATKVAWRALAMLQVELEALGEAS